MCINSKQESELKNGVKTLKNQSVMIENSVGVSDVSVLLFMQGNLKHLAFKESRQRRILFFTGFVLQISENRKALYSKLIIVEA